MANVYIRYFNTAPEVEPGTVLSLGINTADALNKIEVQQYLVSEGIAAEPLERDLYVCRDEDGLSPSEAEIVLRPPLSDAQKKKFGRVIAHAVRQQENWVNVVDCTAPDTALDWPYIAQA